MTKIEEVARALEAKLTAQGFMDYEEAARAAIEAMREPTLEMLQDGHEAARSIRSSGAGGQTIDNVIRMQTARENAAWRAMIETALNEGSDG